MEPLPPQRLGQLMDVARLQDALADRLLSRPAAVAEARRLGLDADLIDLLAKTPGRSGVAFMATRPRKGPSQWIALRLPCDPTATDAVEAPHTRTNQRLREVSFSSIFERAPLCEEQARALVARFSERLGFPVVLDWASRSSEMSVPLEGGTQIVVPGGVVRSPCIDPDSLALMVAHERAHIALQTSDEARCDDWAVRHGLRLLWGDPPDYFERGSLAAYRCLVAFNDTATEPLTLLSRDDLPLVMNGAGYPTLQSRWQIFKAGLLGLPMPMPTPG